MAEAKQGCGCEDGTVQALDETAAQAAFATLDSRIWTLAEDCKSISRAFVARNFMAAMSFLNKVAEIAESEGMKHHPDMHLTSYRNVKIDIYTHAVGGLSEFDFKLAKAMDDIPVDYSPKWAKERGL
jgi:4a-hydroxytetrahydrobiopterin dehydratase